MASNANNKLIGRKLGDYTIQSILGQGGMAQVYKGYDEDLQRYSAVKVITPSATPVDDELEYRERFMREARAIARLNHPRIVGLYQFGKNEAENLYYMAMAYIDGRDLRYILKEYVKAGTYPTTTEILQVMRDIASALDYAHSMGVIHRDVKPSNIMVTEDGHAVLTDFGLALSATEGTLGNTFGSVHYIAPEQAVSSAQASAQSDLYSLGVVLYEMMSGRVPFDDASAMSVALKHISDPPPPPSVINPKIPPQVESVIMKLLDKDPQRRFPSGAQFIQALEQAFAIYEEEDTEKVSQQPIPNAASFEPTPKRPDTEPRKPTRQVDPPPNVNARAILGDAGDDYSGQPQKASLEDEKPTHITDPSRPKRSSSTLARRKPSRAPWFIAGAVILVIMAALVGVILLSSRDLNNAYATATSFALRNASVTSEFETQVAVGNATATGVIELVMTQTQEGAQLAALASETAAGDFTATAVQDAVSSATALALAAVATEAPSETPEPTDSITTEVSPTPTPTSTATPTATHTPTPTHTATPSNTPTPEMTATPELNALPGEPQLLLRYDSRSIVLYNRDLDEGIDIAPLEFAQGSITYSSQRLIGLGEQLPSSMCGQVWTMEFTTLPADEFPAEICESRRGFAGTNRTFWISDEPGTTFTVSRRGRVIAECPTVTSNFVDEMRCIVELR